MTRSLRMLAVATASLALLAGFAAPVPAVDSTIPPVENAAGFQGPQFSPPVEASVFLGDLRDLPIVTEVSDVPVPRGDLTSRSVRKRPVQTPEAPEAPKLDLPVQALVTNPGTRTQFANPVRNFGGQNGGFPPDPIGDVGVDHYIQAVNTTFAIYRKDDPTGTPVAGPSAINSIWAGAGGDCQTDNNGDPVVVYDSFAGRFVISQFTNRGNNDVCIAVSRTGNPVTGGWNRYEFNMGGFPDYFKLGVWPTGYFLASNQGNTVVAAFDRAQMIAGNAAGMVTFSQSGHLGANMMLPSDADGPTPPPAGDPNVFYRFVDGDNFGGADRLELFEFDVDFGAGTSSFTGPTNIPMAGFDSDMCGSTEFTTCVPQPGTAQTLDPIIEWPMWRFQYRNFGANERLVGNFTVDVGDSDLAGIRWFELRKTGAGPWTVFQQGTHSPDSTHRWMGSIAMDRDGNIALGYSASDATSTFPSLWYAGRLAGDPLGTLPQGEVQLIAGTASQTGCQNVGSVCIGRYGDYASMNVDPVDDCTFWFTGEHFDGNRRSQVGAFRLCNDPPAADAGGPYTTSEGTNETVDASGSTDPNPASTLTYEWDLDNDGTFETPGQTAVFDRVGRDGVFTICLRVTDEAGASDIDCTDVTVTNVAPVVTLATDAPADEGSAVRVFGTISDAGWEDPLTGTVDWRDGTVDPVTGIEEHVRPDGTLTFDLSHRYGDDGVYPVEVCGSDDDTTVCRTIEVRIDNVAPTVTLDPAQVTAILEGETVDVSATFSDPGWLDTYTAEIDWGHVDLGADLFDPATLTTDSSGPGPDLGEATGSRQVGDNGAFPVSITVTDDDGGAGNDGFTLDVGNVDPTAEIDETGTVLVNGVPTFVADVGDPVDLQARSTDPGSDDLTLRWDFDDGAPAPDVTMTSLVNPPASDPFPSPTVQPRDETSMVSPAFADACVYEVMFSSDDDDGGSAADSVQVLIAGGGDRNRPTGWWHRQYMKDGTKADFDLPTLECYLTIARFGSSVFDEATPLATLAHADDVLHGAGPSALDRFDRDALAAWLNLANGGVGFTDLVHDADGDGVVDTTFGDAMADAEAVRLDPSSTDGEVEDARRVVHRISHP